MQLPGVRRLLVNPSREEMSQAEVTWGLLHCSAIRTKYLRSFMSKDHWEALGLFRALCWGSCRKKGCWICHSPQVETALDRLQGQGCSTAGRRAGALASVSPSAPLTWSSSERYPSCLLLPGKWVFTQVWVTCHEISNQRLLYSFSLLAVGGCVIHAGQVLSPTNRFQWCILLVLENTRPHFP